MTDITADITPGHYTLTATRTGFMTGTRQIQVLEYGPHLVVTNITFPDDARTGRNARISMTVENVGRERNTQNISITAQNNTDTMRVNLNPGASRDLTFTLRPQAAGNIPVTVGNQTFVFPVAERQTEIPWLGLLVGGLTLILLILLVIAFMRHREDKNEKDRKQKPKKPAGKKKEACLLGGLFKGDLKKKSDKPKKSASSQKYSAPPPKKTAPKAPPASKPKNSNQFSSSNKAPELKNSQKKARAKK
jgi:hypothetical protein